MSQPKIILVAGPTASGKSALALDLARKSKGSIVNADASQVYEGLRILSSQPDDATRAEIPHHLYGTLSPAEHSSVGRWLELASPIIRDIIDEGRVPIVVGGTGLYFKVLFGGLADIPSIPQHVRAETQALYDHLGEEKFRAELAKVDPQSAERLARNDRQRLTRAYEVAEHTGQPLSAWQKIEKPAMLKDAVVEKHLLLPERDILYAACDKRFLRMIENGALDEVRAFRARAIDPSLPAAKTIGLRELGAHLDKKVSLNVAITTAQQMTRNYAKRQMTWFRNQKLDG